MRLSHVQRWTLGALGCLALAGPAVRAGSVDLEWDPVPEATGYRVYYGASAGQYTQTKDVGNRATTTMANLTDCTDYYMAVKAYARSGVGRILERGVRWARPPARRRRR
jgi:hypothetical protein